MNERPGDLSPIVLAHCERFRLGAVLVDPARRQIDGPGGQATLEPRVMEILVALAEAEGRVLSRYDLCQRVWGGRIVGDNAIQRAISRLRSVAKSAGGESFTIENVKGVGYRLAVGGEARLETVLEDRTIRRRAVVAGLGAVIAAISAGLWFRRGPALDSPAGRSLLESAEAETRSSYGSDSSEQAIALYQAAAAETPELAPAWSGLAMAYMRILYSAPDEQVNQLAEKGKAAARRALAIDRDNLRARAALILIEPSFGQWNEQARRLEALLKTGEAEWETQLAAAQLRMAGGDYGRGVPVLEKILARFPAMSGLYPILFNAYWRMGEPYRAEQLLDSASKRWPRQYELWNLRFDYLALSGQFDQARHFIAQDSSRPRNLSRSAVRKRLALLDVLATGDRKARQDLVEDFLADLRSYVWAYPRAMAMMAVLGEGDIVLEALEGFYYGKGRFARPLARYSRRPVNLLYLPHFDSLRRDPQFMAFLSRVGIPLLPRM